MNLTIRKEGLRWQAAQGRYMLVECADGEYVRESDHASLVAALLREIERYREYEYVEAAFFAGQNGPSVWRGPRYKIPHGYCEISNESGEPGSTWVEDSSASREVKP